MAKRWRKNPMPTGLARVGSGVQGSKLFDGELSLASVNCSGGKSKAFNGLGMVLFIWMLYCACIVFKSESERYLLDKKAGYENFKVKCVNKNGTVRHENSFLTFDVYCMEKSGNEQFFTHSSTYNFVIPFVDKVTFGVGNLLNK